MNSKNILFISLYLDMVKFDDFTTIIKTSTLYFTLYLHFSNIATGMFVLQVTKHMHSDFKKGKNKRKL